MAETTGIFDNHGDVTKISTMPHCRFNTDFHGDADDGKRINAAIAQRGFRGVPSNADIVILSKMASLGSGFNSGMR